VGSVKVDKGFSAEKEKHMTIKVWPWLQGFLAPIEQEAVQIAVPIATGAVDAVLSATPGLSVFETMANSLIAGAAQFLAQGVHPNVAAAAVANAVAAKAQ
jgi:hypothetical protein